MNTIRMTVVLLLGATVLDGCDDRSIPTASSDHPAPVFDVAAGLNSVVTDPLGDAKLNHHNQSGPGSDQKVPDYLDVVRAEVTELGTMFTFIENVGDVIPADPSAASGGSSGQVWIFGLDTDPTAAPQGDPLANGSVNPFEFFVAVEWDGSQFTGRLYDRRPLLTGGALVVTPVQFTVAGSQVTLVVRASTLGDPPSFGWAAGTVTRHTLDSEGYQTLDLAPDAGLASWPQ